MPRSVAGHLPPKIHKVKSKLADGLVVEYHYTERGGPRFWSSRDRIAMGSASYFREYRAACGSDTRHEDRKANPKLFESVIEAYVNDRTFKDLAESTRRNIIRYLHHKNGIIATFGKFPIGAMEHPKIKMRVRRWQDESWGDAEGHLIYARLRAIVSWAVKNGAMANNYVRGIERRYTVDRSGIIWMPDEIEKFTSPPVPEYVQRVLTVICETGLAPIDAIQFTTDWVQNTPSGRRIVTKRQKTGQNVYVPVMPAIADLIDATPAGGHILTMKSGKPWKSTGSLGDAVAKWRDKIGLRKELHLYDARGTAATRLLNAGLSVAELAAHMGWSPSTAANMVSVYAQASADLTDTMIEKLKGRG